MRSKPIQEYYEAVNVIDMESKFEVCNEDGKLIASYQHEGPAYSHAYSENLIVYDHQINAYTDASGAVIPDTFVLFSLLDNNVYSPA